MRISFKLNDFVIKLMILFPITTTIQGLPALEQINKLVIVFLVSIFLFSFFSKPIQARNLLYIVLTIILVLNSFIVTQFPLYNFNDCTYFGFWMLFFLYLYNYYDEINVSIKKSTRFIHFAIILWHLIVIASLFYPKAFSNNWDGVYFSSFSSGYHRFGSTCLFIAILVWIYYREEKNKFSLFYLVLPAIGTLLCGARTYLGVLGVLFVCIYYAYIKQKKYFWYTIIPLMLLSIIIILKTPTGQKIINQTFVTENETTVNDLNKDDNNTASLEQITNGRTVFWRADLEAFSQLSTKQKLVGNGFNFVYDVNLKAVYSKIWAHNDFINVLLNYGYIGLIIFVMIFIRVSIQYVKRQKLDWVLTLGYIFIWFFNAMFNMVYTYTCSVLLIPFLVYAFRKETEKELDNIKKVY